MPDIIIPPRVKPENDNQYFEILTKAVFQAGFSWKIVERKWSGFQEVFEGFDFNKIAKWDEDKILEVVESSLIIRNLKKIRATVYNASQCVQLVDQFGSLEEYVTSIRDDGYKMKVKALTKKFKWLGKTGSFFFFYSINENVPAWENR